MRRASDAGRLTITVFSTLYPLRAGMTVLEFRCDLFMPRAEYSPQ